MKRIIVVCLVSFLALAGKASAANMVSPDTFKQWIDGNKPVTVVDIQPAGEYEAHHFKGSIETNAFPAKDDEEKKKLDKVLTAIKASKDDVVIICPRGRSGASNAYYHLKSQGVDEKRLFILEGGMQDWPYKDMLVKGR